MTRAKDKKLQMSEAAIDADSARSNTQVDRENRPPAPENGKSPKNAKPVTKTVIYKAGRLAQNDSQPDRTGENAKGKVSVKERSKAISSERPVHPGSILKAELERLNWSVAAAVDELEISRPQLYRILKCESEITPEVALKLEKKLKGSAEHWLILQNKYSLAQLRGGALRPPFKMGKADPTPT